MKINKIKVSNFKSFKNLDLELGNFNVIIGANASGKSNFVQIFRFLRDIEQNDLRNAISMNGGITSLCNIQRGCEKFRVEISLDSKMAVSDGKTILKILQTNVAFSIGPESSSKGFSIYENECSLRFELVPQKKEKNLWQNVQSGNVGYITIKTKNGEPDLEVTPKEMEDQLQKIVFLPQSLKNISRIFKKEDFLFFQKPFPFLPIQENFSNIGVYDFDPHSAKNPVKIAGKADLEEDGKNLALILSHVLEDDKKKRKLNNLLNSLLPFVIAAGTEKFAEKSLMVTLQEKFYSRELRADLLSDGTLDVIALLVTLYFENKSIAFLEEPERNIHPQLIAGMVEMMKEASRKKQIIVTTHSPEIVKHAGIENILLVSRDEEGFSTITRPADKKDVQVFLQNEIGLDELYIQNLLTA